MRCIYILFLLLFAIQNSKAQLRIPLNFAELGLVDDDLEKNVFQSLRTLHEITNRGDVFDQPLQILYWVWNETEGTWHKSRRDLYTNNPDQQLIHSVAQNWNGSAWIDQYRSNYVYTPDHQLRLFLFEFWDGLNWHLYVRFTYEYDEQGQLISFLTEDWNEEQWDNRYRKLYAHDHEQWRSIAMRQEWWNGGWYNRQQEIRQYDPAYNCQEELFMEWNEHEWAPTKRNTHTYTAQSLLEQTIQQVKDGSTWKELTVISYAYDESGNRTAETHTQLEPDTLHKNATWTFQYDARDNLKERSFWCQDETQWNLRIRDLYTHDILDRNTSVLTQGYAGQYKNLDYVEYTYAQIPDAHYPDISTLMNLHPIPAQTTLHLSIDGNFRGKGQLSIYSLDGKKMVSQAFDGLIDQTIPIHFLPDGLYVLKFIGHDGTGVKAFVKFQGQR